MAGDFHHVLLLISSIIESGSVYTNKTKCLLILYLYSIDSELITLGKDTTISTGAAVGITAVIIGTIALIIGILAGVLLYHCFDKHRFQSSKAETSSHQSQPAVVTQHRDGLEYEEVVELKENTAYGPVQSIELKPCEAYVPVQH